MGPYHVHADDPVSSLVYDDFHERSFVGSRHRVLERAELGLVNLDISVFVESPVFGEANGAEVGVGENGCGDVLKIGSPGVVSEVRVRKAMALSKCNGGQLKRIRAVSNSIDTRDGGLSVFLHHNAAVFGQFDANLLESKPTCLRVAADGAEDDVGFDNVARAQVHQKVAITSLFNLDSFCLLANVHSLLNHGVSQIISAVGVKAS
mmetsp:Transcript_6483/g.9975  ORF Transcript_6483/g.9975 Transcript_6483/m.9975 type:complete len:206 (-) Transcript_6483:1041-1658(-)